GFIGRTLTEYLASNMPQLDLFGTTRWRSTIDRITELPNGIQLIESDLTDYDSVMQLVNRIRPSLIFHLAGQSHMPASWMSPNATILNALTMQLNLLNAIKFINSDTKLVVPVSNHIYGMTSESQLPATEKTGFAPITPLGMGHALQDMLAQQYYGGYGIQTVRVRLFDLIGPNQPDLFLLSHIAKQIAEAETGQRSPLVRVPNISAKRDWTDVRDVARGLWLLAERGESGKVYVLTSEQRHSRQELCTMLKQQTTAPIEFRDMAPAHPEPESIYGNSAEFRQATGWSPQITVQQSLQDLLNHWRFQVKFVGRLGQLVSQAQQVR
ncbi:MAG: GDP-mannose 4,6-dehydratase, partial [Cyanobacteria bacterium HKST-UBA05]|nr:GDP-mannose 4,6-dehydratase [Cyanobacteria bacterium HKST-UBA05]